MKPRSATVASRAVALLLLPLALGSVAWADNGSPLVDAVEAKNREAVVALLDKGVDVRQRSADGTTALHWAAHYDDRDLVKRLLKGGADPNVVNDYGSSPMQEAAVTADPQVIEMLLKSGADVDSPNPEGQTALMVVARTGNVEAAKVLLKHGARVNATESWGGQSALMWAAAESQPEMVKLLVEHGADVNARSLVRDWQRRITAEGRPKNENHGGFTPLLYAAREGCIDCIKYLLKGHADINLTDPDETTPLNMALLNMRFDTAAYLISQHADVNRWDFWGRTPLYNAIDLDTVPRGGRPDLPSLDKATGLDVAELLLKAGADVNAQLKLRPPYRNGVFDRGGDQVISTGATPLLVAAKIGDVPAVKLLLKYKPNVELPNSEGVTPLMTAAGLGHSFNPTRGRYKTDAEGAECVKLLQAAGGKINEADLQGLTPLHAAAQHGWDETVKLLVADGADLQPKDKLGLTPIDHAEGKQPRAFLEPEHVPHKETIALLTGYIVAATGQPPIQFAGTLNRQTRGTGGAVGGGLGQGPQVAQNNGAQGGGGSAARRGRGQAGQGASAQGSSAPGAGAPAGAGSGANAPGAGASGASAQRAGAKDAAAQGASAPTAAHPSATKGKAPAQPAVRPRAQGAAENQPTAESEAAPAQPAPVQTAKEPR
ncbi:MAG TPA: ankyrin repeat domain-containing protein [Steroidobacteraceae bacterium]|nr:ankyrin repeat domain-containing protein [Steroidobacteraceae bacterium]